MGITSIMSIQAQTTKPTNVYSTNLEENMYFEKYSDQNKVISGIHFMVLSDGDNSRDITPAFTVKLYLIPEGKTSREDVIVIKSFRLDGLYHMGSREFKNESVDLHSIPDLKTGNYRLGLWVNADNDFEEDTSDNAYLFRNTIRFTAPDKTSQPTSTQKPNTQKPTEDDDDNDDWDDDDWDDDWDDDDDWD